jgi:hypothetical protein
MFDQAAPPAGQLLQSGTVQRYRSASSLARTGGDDFQQGLDGVEKELKALRAAVAKVCEALKASKRD